MKKVRIENIIFLQGDDYITMEKDLGDNDGEQDVINYLLQWFYPGEHDESVYNAEDINTPFLGYERHIDNDTFLFSLNRSMGYAGLSRILEIYEV